MSKKIDLTGKRFGKLNVLSESGFRVAGQLKWKCICDCGREVHVAGMHLRKGSQVSCGCHKAKVAGDRNRTHGQATRRSSEYSSWANMKFRCAENAVGKDYKNYFARGIRVCDRWQTFENFLEDMGEKPVPKEMFSIERINNSGNYEPSNCRWATVPEQALNKRTNRLVLYKGLEVPFKVAYEMSPKVVSMGLARGRFVRDGWSIEQSLETPPIPFGGDRHKGRIVDTLFSRP